MRTRSRKIALRLLVLLAAMLARQASAQDQVAVITQVKPPYSPYLSDYVGFDNKIVITLTNKTNAPQSVRLVGQVKGEMGVTVTIPNSFIPASSIALGPNQVKMIMGAQLKEYLDPDVLQFSGIGKQEVVQGNGLPEGSYSFCIQALDYLSGAQRSLPSPAGCAVFNITHYETPTIMTPTCNGTVAPKNPQSILFTWTQPAGVPPNKVEYLLTIAEIDPPNIDPNQAITAPAPFFETTVASTSFLYTAAAPHLEPGMKYAFRVTAKNKGESKELHFKNEGKSVVCSFAYGQAQLAEEEGQNQEPEDEPNDIPNDVQEEYADPCTALNCAPNPPPAAVQSDHIYQPGEEVQIGYFTLKLTSLSSPSAGNLSGEGTIDAPIFRTKLKATFQGLKANPDHKIYSGKAIGAYDPGAQVDQALRSFGDNMENIAAENVAAVTDFVKNHQKYIENFVDIDAQGLPFAWNKLLDGKLQLVNIAAVEFAPDGARMNAFFDIPIPEANNALLAFGQKNICFHPTGLSVGGLQKLTMLGGDKTFAWGENIDVTLKGTKGEQGTYVKWDCEGYKEMQVDGFFTLKTTVVQKTAGGGPVKASFTFSSVKSWGDMLGVVSVDPFTVKGMKGLGFTFDQVVLDFSDTRNAQGMAFPANYNGGTGNDWRGFYFKEIKATLPNYLRKKNAPVTITMKNAFINKLGFTGTAIVEPVVSLGDGSIGGWSFSIEKIEIALLNNTLTKGAFGGKVMIPIAKTGLGYNCLMSSSDQGLATAFSVNTLDSIDVDMWGAKLHLEENSGITITSQGDDVTVQAVLSGDLTVDRKFAEMKGVSVKIPGVEFEDLTIRNRKPYLSATLFKFASPEKSFAGFPVSIDPQDGIQLKFQNDGKKAGLQLGFHVGLDGNNQSAISGGTRFTLWGTLNEQNGKQSWALAPPTLDAIHVDASVASCDIEGDINLYKGDPKFGDGFRGSLSVTFRPLIKVAATIQFGSTNYQSNTTYRYWYVDAMAVMGPGAGIPVFTGLGIYGFGGGAYYHMKPTSAIPTAAGLEGSPESNEGYQQDTPGQSGSGTQYTPDKGIAFGFKATIVLGTMPNPKAFNGDITLEASFYTGGGLHQISLVGNGYFVSDLMPKSRKPKDKAVVAATVAFQYSTETSSFDGLISIDINLKAGNRKLIVGGGDASLHFSKEKWFIKLGEPDNRIGLTVLDLLEIESYLMIGKNSLPGIPPLPTEPINFQQELPYFNVLNGRKPDVGAGSGFALGQQLNVNTGRLKFLIFYAQIAISFGYDISILNTDEECEHSNGKMGLNGWYAKGQVYAGVEASVGIDIDLWFLDTEFELFKVGLFAGLQAGLPNPTWLKGQVAGSYSALNGALSGHCTFKFKYGNYCDPSKGDPFGGLKIIADINPTGKDVSVFTYPEVAFNLPIGNSISVSLTNEEDEIEVTTFRFGVKRYDIENLKTKKMVAGDWSLENKKLSALFSPYEMFDEKSEHRLTIHIYGDKLVNGEWKRIGENNNPNKEHLEKDDMTFTTGTAPETFVNSNIIATLPGRMQRYYHYSGTAKGYIRFNQYPSNIRNMEPEEEDFKYRFVARVQEIGTGSTVVEQKELEWYPDEKMVRFHLPSTGMKKKTIYIVQIVRQKLSTIKPSNKSKGNQQNSNVAVDNVEKSIGEGQKISVRESRLKSIQLKDNEFLVYQMAFKTSQFSTFGDKFDDYMKSDPEYSFGTGSYKSTIWVSYEGKEPFDWYDLHQTNYKQGSITKYIRPHISVTATDKTAGATNEYFWSLVKTQYVDYVKDHYLNGILRSDVQTNPKVSPGPNPRRLRSYPEAGAYPPGSRLLNGSSIPDSIFPTHAVAVYYDGNGTAGKLTNDEINASYWKDYGALDGSGPSMLKVAGVQDEPKPGNGLYNPNQSLQANIVNKVLFRYDALTVLRFDRKRVAEEMLYRYSISPAVLGMDPEFMGFMKYNQPHDIWLDKPNPNYWDMHINPAKNTRLRIEIDYDYGNGYDREVNIKFPL